MVITAMMATRAALCRRGERVPVRKSVILPPPFQSCAGHHQDGCDEDHGGDQKVVRTEYNQTNDGGHHTHHGREVVLRAQPLLHKDGGKQGGQRKVNAGEIQRQVPQQGADDGAEYPVALVKQGYPETIADAVNSVGQHGAGDQGIGLIRQREDQVRLFLSRLLVGIHHGKPVEQVPGVYHQGGQRGGGKPRPAGQEPHAHILHGTSINKNAHGQSPGQPIAALL